MVTAGETRGKPLAVQAYTGRDQDSNWSGEARSVV
jgi:hypothetical protein